MSFYEIPKDRKRKLNEKQASTKINKVLEEKKLDVSKASLNYYIQKLQPDKAVQPQPMQLLVPNKSNIIS